ncbi:MAG: hydrogenase nickel incorporation protein HypB [Candidatus Krumholzibacteria bacterium]|nr:hydrogenase nickel incorporation protein HypB [Candidatus Krumholzibacteria bacterium]MDH5271383.1 hydrogenase nickel incorporation protein HypB [Candidatus Krumholzibacteria bacterium]
MCGTCGCGQPDAVGHEHGHGHHHHHDHHHEHTHATQSTTLIQVEKALLAENDRFAAENRALFDERRTRCFNLISGPGAGKTTLLEKTLEGLLARSVACAVIEGDQTTDLDAQRIARTGAPVTQIETGRSCHLDAHQVGHALERVEAPRDGLLFIENVGNLICPTEFQLGEHERVTIVSTAEGNDKPAKYPLAFRTATAVVISKIDLLAHVDFDLAEARRVIRGLNPRAPIFELSARTGEGMDAWLSWLHSIR